MIAPIFARRRRPRPALTLVLSFVTICCLALLSILLAAAPRTQQHNASPVKRDVFAAKELECRDIYHAADQCAFFRANCEEDDTGMISYLSFYYCTLPHVKPIGFCVIALWAGFLFMSIGIAASDFLSVNLQSIANILGMSENLAGVTFLAFGNGSSDVFSTWAAMGHHSGSLAIGELIGAASFITAVIPAAMMFIKPFKVGSRSFVRDIIFFAIAIGFSMYFLANGRLELWEALVMIGFYVIYVIIVVGHHWHMTRRRARREKEAAARSHYITSDVDALEDPYHDDDYGIDETQPLGRRLSDADFDDLERADDTIKDAEDEEDDDPDEEDEDRDKVLGEINSNMRIARPQGRRRTNTGPIRPSLIGALEFQAVLSSLRGQQNIPVIPLSRRRRHSGVGLSRRRQPRRQDSAISEGPLPLPRTDSGNSYSSLVDSSAASTRLEADLQRMGSRQRAVSANNAADLRFDPGQIERRVWARREMIAEERAPSSTRSEDAQRSPRPLLSITPPPPEHGQSQRPQLSLSADADRNNLLAPPASHPQPTSATSASIESPTRLSSSPEALSPPFSGRPQLKVSPPSHQRVPTAKRTSSKPSPLMRYHDNPDIAEVEELMLPSPEEDHGHLNDRLQGTLHKRRKWWPTLLLPTPRELFRTLFPSLKLWSKTNIWGKMIGLASAPSVFILTVTLPVVEFDRSQVESKSSSAPAANNIRNGADTDHRLVETNHSSTAEAAVAVEQQLQQRAMGEDTDPDDEEAEAPVHASEIEATLTTAELATEWNRWLVVLQLIITPVAFILLQWAGDDEADSGLYLKILLFALLGSLILVTLLVLTTSPTQPPRWHHFLSFFGFLVSVFWISTIAEEVVGVLKAIGVIFNISEAILGLTIFAVGNSLGDLVADITVARLGFPVMALSACFGGPMMNILIGIGTAGAWHTWKGSQRYHHKHPDRPHKWKSYHLEVDVTLMISAVGLLITLLAYLIVVPLNKWRLDRKIGIGLAALWIIATVTNVVIEVTGIGGKLNYHEDALGRLGLGGFA